MSMVCMGNLRQFTFEEDIRPETLDFPRIIKKTLINENEVLRKAKKNSYFRLEVQFYHVYLQMSLEKLLFASVFPKCMNIV